MIASNDRWAHHPRRATPADLDTVHAMTADTAPMPSSTWAPLRLRVFRALWIATLISNIGTWMQTVGAQWLLVDEPGASTLVALVQTATLAPTLLFALPAGVLADAFDRRRMLLAVQAFQVIVATALAVLTGTGHMPPALLLTFTFLLGIGATLSVPVYQALVPELVPRSMLASASALSGVSMNLARAVGPAIAGLLVAGVGPTAVFAINAVSFLAYCVVLSVWPIPTSDPAELPERFGPALRVGSRYVRHSPVVRRILLRSALFVVPGSALWALLPLIASRRLGLGAGGYGVLLGALGVGAVLGALGLQRIRARLRSNRMTALASLVYCVALLALALVQAPVVVALLLVPAGAAWLAVLVSLNASMQLFLPNWVRARGLSVYLIVFQGCQAVAALAWGAIASQVGLVRTFLAAAAVMAFSAASVRIWPLIDAHHLDRSPAVFWPVPSLDVDPDPDLGPILVHSTYTVPAERQEQFVEAMQWVRRSRLRTGATRWGLFRPGEEPETLVEVYLVPSWAEHLRQHTGRLTVSDRSREEATLALAEGPPVVRHLFPAEPDA
jgi:MFS family permease